MKYNVYIILLTNLSFKEKQVEKAENVSWYFWLLVNDNGV